MNAHVHVKFLVHLNIPVLVDKKRICAVETKQSESHVLPVCPVLLSALTPDFFGDLLTVLGSGGPAHYLRKKTR